MSPVPENSRHAQPNGHPVFTLLGSRARYAFALVGPSSGAVAQFALSLVLLHALTPFEFGSFSFLLVTAQLSTGLSTALLCAPLASLLVGNDEEARIVTLRALMAANLCLSLVSLILFYALGCILGFTSMASALFAGFAALSLLRWFARAYGYANDAPWRTIISDLAYSLVLVAGVASIWFTGRLSLASASFVIALAAVAGLLPFGAPYFRQQLLDFSPRNLIAYRSIWREHSRWALVGVITTEATGNAHAYIVTLAAGPAAFARIAVSALLVRPIQVAMNALSEYERPQLARSIAGGQTEVMRSLRVFRLVLAAAWLGTAALAVLVLTGAPHAIFFREIHRRRSCLGGDALAGRCCCARPANSGEHALAGGRAVPVPGVRQRVYVRNIGAVRCGVSGAGGASVVSRRNPYRGGVVRVLHVARGPQMATERHGYPVDRLCAIRESSTLGTDRFPNSRPCRRRQEPDHRKCKKLLCRRPTALESCSEELGQGRIV